MAEIEVRFCGRLVDRFGPSARLPCGPEGLSVAAFRDHFGGLPKARPLMGDTLVDEARHVPAGDSIEFLPPVAGG
jgi:molybdopterin converting factor small subunit